MDVLNSIIANAEANQRASHYTYFIHAIYKGERICTLILAVHRDKKKLEFVASYSYEGATPRLYLQERCMGFKLYHMALTQTLDNGYTCMEPDLYGSGTPLKQLTMAAFQVLNKWNDASTPKKFKKLVKNRLLAWGVMIDVHAIDEYGL